MKLLLVLGSDKTYDTLSVFLRPLGFDMVRYRHVQKAMDNVEEIDPEGIIISAKDFPRHWKTFVGFVRFDRSQHECPVVVLKGEHFPDDEVDKALALDVNGLVLESLDNPAEAEKIQTLLTRYIAVDDKRTNRRYRPEEWSRINFVFSNPEDEKLVTGTVKTVSSTGISFGPDHPGLIENIKIDTEIQKCTLRAGEHIFSPVCAVRRTSGDIISLEFSSFPDAEKETLDTYLENLPLEEMRAKLKAAL